MFTSGGCAENERVKAWIVREWASAGMLSDAITRGWFLNEDDTQNWSLILNTALEIAQAMAFLHDEGIIFGSLNSYRCTFNSCKINVIKT